MCAKMLAGLFGGGQKQTTTPTVTTPAAAVSNASADAGDNADVKLNTITDSQGRVRSGAADQRRKAGVPGLGL